MPKISRWFVKSTPELKQLPPDTILVVLADCVKTSKLKITAIITKFASRHHFRIQFSDFLSVGESIRALDSIVLIQFDN